MDPLLTEFDSFVRHRTPALLRSAYLLTGDQYLAEDLAQSALARTHRSWNRLHDSGNAEAYTHKTMYHLQVSWWRRTSKVVDLPTSGKIKSIQFTADGKVLVRQATRIVVLDAGFRQLGQVDEPRDVRGLTLLAYVR